MFTMYLILRTPGGILILAVYTSPFSTPDMFHNSIPVFSETTLNDELTLLKSTLYVSATQWLASFLNAGDNRAASQGDEKKQSRKKLPSLEYRGLYLPTDIPGKEI